MKKKELTKIKEKGVSGLAKKTDEIKVQINECYAKLSVGKEKNLKKVKNLKRDLAQILTLIREEDKK